MGFAPARSESRLPVTTGSVLAWASSIPTACGEVPISTVAGLCNGHDVDQGSGLGHHSSTDISGHRTLAPLRERARLKANIKLT